MDFYRILLCQCNFYVTSEECTQALAPNQRLNAYNYAKSLVLAA